MLGQGQQFLLLTSHRGVMWLISIQMPLISSAPVLQYSFIAELTGSDVWNESRERYELTPLDPYQDAFTTLSSLSSEGCNEDTLINVYELLHCCHIQTVRVASVGRKQQSGIPPETESRNGKMKQGALEWFPPRRCFYTLQNTLWS